jgi:hypothetical protein
MTTGGVKRYVLGGLLVQAWGPADAGGGATATAAGAPSLVQAAGRGFPWVNLKDGVVVEPGEGPLAAALGGEPRALAAGDLDADGVPDLVVGSSGAGGGQLALYRGNVDAIYPHSPEAQARRRAGTFTEEPFLGVIGTMAMPETPDFVMVGDFDGDGHWDIVAAARGSQTLHLVSGNGRGNLGAARRLALPGAVTALGVGDVNRRDGLEDLLLGIATPTGPQLLVFEGPEGALHATPEVLPMPGEVRAVAVGSVVTRGMADLVAAAGEEVVIVHGRDRKIALDPERQATVLPARQTRHAFGAEVVALALGDFRGVSRTEIAVLDATGTVHLLGRPKAAARWAAEALFVRPGGAALTGAAGQLVRAKVSSLPQDDLLVLDPATRQLHLLLGDPTQVQAGQILPGAGTLPLMTALETAAALLAVLPMRLNRDALDDLVVLQAGQDAPSVLLTVPVNTFIVGNTNDSGPDSLRQAILDANASPGADAIDFHFSPFSDTVEFKVLSNLPRITEALIVDGTTYVYGPIRLKTSTASPTTYFGLQLGGGSSLVRGIELRGFRAPIEVASAGNLVEGNKILPPAANEFRIRFGVRIPTAVNNSIGGTTPAARNEIDGGASFAEGGAVFISGGSASGNKVQGNLIRRAAYGVVLAHAPGNLVGRTVAGARNVISGNNQDGVQLQGASGTLLQGNFIGTTATGTAGLPNTGHGVLLTAASGNTIGGTAAGAGNTLAFNGGDGVFVESGTGNAIRRNAIFANTGLGIDLAPSGVTPNDPGDGDTGANNLQNFPVLTAVTSTATTTTITGLLNSVASTGFTLEFFRNLTCDGPTNGEGRVFLRDVPVTTNASGTATFSVAVTPPVPAGQIVTATATRTATRDTSEFSACRAATLAGPSGKPPRGGGLPSILAE